MIVTLAFKWYRLPLQYDSSSMEGRWEFDGEIADSSIRDRLKGNLTKNCLKRGSQNHIRYINC